MKPIVAVAAVIEKEGRFLITKRLATSHLGHCWEFPGGKIEPGETVDECAIRECQEEIGVLVKPLRYLRNHTYEYPGKSVFLHFVLCSLVSGEPRAIECADWCWIEAHQFVDFEFPPADQAVIDELRKKA